MPRDVKNPPTGDYRVGYSRPPKHTRWQKGQSGNPKGRPRKVPVDLIDVVDASVSVTIGGKQRKISGFEASFRKLAQKALKGELRAMIRFVRYCEEYGVITSPPVESGGVVHVPKGVDPYQWLIYNTEAIPQDET
jgi:hypothetical protein